MIHDLINGFFELAGGIVVALNVRDIWKRGMVAGHTPFTITFFWSWGLWNVIYYPAIGQWWSTIGAWGLMIANLCLVFSVIKFRSK